MSKKVRVTEKGRSHLTVLLYCYLPLNYMYTTILWDSWEARKDAKASRPSPPRQLTWKLLEAVGSDSEGPEGLVIFLMADNRLVPTRSPEPIIRRITRGVLTITIHSSTPWGRSFRCTKFLPSVSFTGSDSSIPW